MIERPVRTAENFGDTAACEQQVCSKSQVQFIYAKEETSACGKELKNPSNTRCRRGSP